MIPKISRGARNLPPKKKESVSEETDKLQLDAREIEKWWTDSRWNYTKRTYAGTCGLVMFAHVKKWTEHLSFVYQ